jgi:hypothetical protein
LSAGLRPHRARGAAVLLLALVSVCAACAPAPTPTWQRPDVSAASTRRVELDCHQRAIVAIDAATSAADVQRVHTEREQYFARCMRGSGFELR